VHREPRGLQVSQACRLIQGVYLLRTSHRQLGARYMAALEHGADRQRTALRQPLAIALVGAGRVVGAAWTFVHNAAERQGTPVRP